MLDIFRKRRIIFACRAKSFNFCGVFNEVIDSDMARNVMTNEDFQCFRELQTLLDQEDQVEACEVLEDPLDEAIAGHIDDVVFKNDNDFYLFIDFFNCSSVNKIEEKILRTLLTK